MWTFQKQYENNLFVEAEIEPKWTTMRANPHSLGQKVYYRCKHTKCPARIHLLFWKNQTKISLFSNLGIFILV